MAVYTTEYGCANGCEIGSNNGLHTPQSQQKKLDALQKHERHNNSNRNTMKYTFHRRLVNLTNIKLVMIK
jgi:hypothetical protein